jgi:hypothetical protein
MTLLPLVVPQITRHAGNVVQMDDSDFPTSSSLIMMWRFRWNHELSIPCGLEHLTDSILQLVSRESIQSFEIPLSIFSSCHFFRVPI